MEMRQLQFFITVAKHRNFTTAATELHISQSTLSRQITAMERELNVLLLFRDNRNVNLTKSGEYLYEEFSKLYMNYTHLIENAQNIFKGYSGNLKFGLLEEFTLEGTMQNVLHQYHKSFPNQTIDMRRGSFQNLADGILDFTYDFITTFFFDISTIPLLRYKLIEKVQDGIIISRKNPLSNLNVFLPEKFREETFILLSKDDSKYAATGAIEFCTAHGFYPKIKIAPDLNTAMLWVEAGMGLAFTYSNSVAVHNPSMKFIPLQEKDFLLESSLVLAWNTHNTNPVIHNFIKCYEEYKARNQNISQLTF